VTRLLRGLGRGIVLDADRREVTAGRDQLVPGGTIEAVPAPPDRIQSPAGVGSGGEDIDLLEDERWLAAQARDGFVFPVKFDGNLHREERIRRSTAVPQSIRW
jgi:hypothetical protein